MARNIRNWFESEGSVSGGGGEGCGGGGGGGQWRSVYGKWTTERTTENVEIFGRILFSRIVLRHICHVKNSQLITSWFTYIRKQTDFAILQGFYFHETKFPKK